MTPTDLDAIRAMIREEVARGATSPDPAATPAATPAAPSPEHAGLIAEVERLRSSVARLSTEPIRRGLAYQPSHTTGGADAGAPMDALVLRARSESPALALVVERAIPRLDEKGVSPGSLTSVLAAVLRAAESDGILGNPAPAHWA